MSMAIPDSLQNVRNATLVMKPYIALRSKGVSHEQALQFSKGYVALEGHQNILSEAGKILFGSATNFVAPEAGSFSPHLSDRLNNVIPELPSVRSPKLHLFVSPSDSLTTAEKSSLIQLFNSNPWGKTHALQISRGCSNQCLICGFDAATIMTHMPYPMILAIAKEFISAEMMFKGNTLSYYLDSDPFLYRDKAFDADFGDVMRALKEEKFNKYGHMANSMHLILTHGWWQNDKYAQAAAIKFREYGIGGVLLTIHLFHREIERNLTDPKKLQGLIDKYAERFRNAMSLLRPNIRLIGIEGADIPEVFSLEYVRSLFHNKIKTGLEHLIALSDLPTYVTDQYGRYEMNPYEAWGVLVKEGFIEECTDCENRTGINRIGRVSMKIDEIKPKDFSIGNYNEAQNWAIGSFLRTERSRQSKSEVEERSNIVRHKALPILISAGRGKTFAERLGVSFPDGSMGSERPNSVIFRPNGEVETIHETSEGNRLTILHKLF